MNEILFKYLQKVIPFSFPFASPWLVHIYTLQLRTIVINFEPIKPKRAFSIKQNLSCGSVSTPMAVCVMFKNHIGCNNALLKLAEVTHRNIRWSFYFTTGHNKRTCPFLNASVLLFDMNISIGYDHILHIISWYNENKFILQMGQNCAFILSRILNINGMFPYRGFFFTCT